MSAHKKKLNADFPSVSEREESKIDDEEIQTERVAVVPTTADYSTEVGQPVSDGEIDRKELSMVDTEYEKLNIGNEQTTFEDVAGNMVKVQPQFYEEEMKERANNPDPVFSCRITRRNVEKHNKKVSPAIPNKAQCRNSGGHLDVVQLFVTAGANIDSQDNRKVLMAEFRKGHIKVVKWMVKHVNQFPSDTELSRYIATITDMDLQKECQQCMEIIVSAKDRRAAEANKNATDLLEELDKERQEEERRKAAAAKKREKKKKKKKQKQESKEKEQGNSKNSTPEPESGDSQQMEVEKEKLEEQLVIQPPSATTTSTLGFDFSTSSEKTHYEKAQEASNPSILSVKTSPALVNSPKRGQKKEDGWKEVIRKSKKVQVPERRGGFGSPSAATTGVTMSNVAGPIPASLPTFNRPDGRLQHHSRGNSQGKLVPGTIKVLQRPGGAGTPKHEPQPVPIVPNQSTTTITTQTVTSANTSLNMSSSGQFSPFDNFFSNAFSKAVAKLLGKKDDNLKEGMNFASVAAAGVVPTFSGSTAMSPEPNSPDPALQAKAPGFKLQHTSGPRMMSPQDMNPGFRAQGFPMPLQMMEMNMHETSFKGASPTPIGPPRPTSPLPPFTPPMPDMIRPNMDDRRQPRPIGGERTHRKAPGPPMTTGFDYGESFWNYQGRSTMSTNPGPGGDAWVSNRDNDSPGHSEDLSDPNFSLYGQSSGLPPMPLFNGVGSSYLSGGFGNGGDSLPSMWSQIHESGVSGKKKV